MSADVQSILSTALSSSALSKHLDEDSSEYILSILLDDPNDVVSGTSDGLRELMTLTLARRWKLL